MGARGQKTLLFLAAGLLISLLLILAFGSGKEENGQNAIVYISDRTPVYSQGLAALFPDAKLQEGNGQVFAYLEQGAAAEAMDLQAFFLLREGFARHWYPHYLATPVIAVDRDLTDQPISGWEDLASAGEMLALPKNQTELQRVIFAISYGLEGEDSTLESGIQLIKGRRKEGLLNTKNWDAPLLICYDYQAVALKKAGRNLEIVIPKEGTLSYVKGLLSRSAIIMPEELDEQLLRAGLRLTDGRCDARYYPSALAYASAALIPDEDSYSRQVFKQEAAIQREALGARLYTTADGREHQLANALLAAAVLLWAATVVSRATQKRVQAAAVILSVLLIFWAALRLVKWNLMLEDSFGRYLWFSYLPFQMLISLLLLWLAWGINRQDGRRSAPFFLRVSAACCLLLALLVFTNDWHQLVYVYDLSTPGWMDNYRYGIAYYIILGFFSLQCLLAVTILMLRCVRDPRKKGLVFPVLQLLFFVAYGYGYVKRIPLAYESDFVMMFAVLSILFFETSIRSGMIPVNTKYTKFFAHSPLAIQIIDEGGALVSASKDAVMPEEKVVREILRSDEQIIRLNEDTLLFSRAIPGGFAIWRDDISKLNRLHAQIATSVQKLERTTSFLEKNARVRREAEEERVRNDLINALEAEISEKLSEIQSMIRELDQAEDGTRARDTAMIAISLSLVKRRSDLFFSKQEGASLTVPELMLCTEELAEYAAVAGTEVRMINELNGELPAFLADLFYSFFADVLLYCLKQGFPRILSKLYREDRQNAMWMMLPKHGKPYAMGERLRDALGEQAGSFDCKDLDDAVGLRLLIPQGGGAPDA